jgi:chromosome segregation protein
LYLKSLTLKGFKSFADRTRVLLEPGVTVVVGPNGSGKSNITDAVLWVLGEQSAKSLRGQSMEDVIFAGSSARKAVGVCEVDLVLDNQDRTLPLEFDEITLTRRMFRSGESEYLINQSPARLMDFQDLLSDSGLGRDTHSIISQGRLDEILNSKPEDRRVLVEEAAGIRKHRKRKERALRKLTSMDGHIDAARHILREIDRQLKPLQRQADRAQQHEEVSGMLREAEVSLAVNELRTLQAEWDELLAREESQDSEISLMRLRLAEKERELERFQSLLEEKGLFVGDLSDQRRRLQTVLERLNSGLLLLEEKGKNLVERLSELRAKVHHNETRLTSRRDEFARLAEERSETDTQLQGYYQRLGELRREGEAVKKARLAAEADVDATEAAILKARKRIEDLQAESTTLENTISGAALERELLESRQESLEERRAEAADTLSARRGRLDQLDRAVSKTRKEIALADADVDRRLRVLASRREELTEARDEANSVHAEMLALEEVDRAFEGATPALAWALSKRTEEPGILGAVSDTLDVAEGYERLAEHALGPDLFGVLVENESALQRVVAMLASQESGDVSLIPLDARVPGHPSALPGSPLADHISCDDRMLPAVEALIGDVRVVDSLEEALRAGAKNPGARFGTREGHLVYPSGKVSLGPTSDTSSGVLSRRRRLNELADAEHAVDVRLGEIEASVADAEEAVRAAQQDALELGQRLATQSGELESLKVETGRLEQAVQSVAAESESLAARLKELEEQRVKAEPQLAQAKESLAGARQELADLEKTLGEQRAQRDTRYREEAGFSTRLSECQADIAQVSEREVFLKRQITTVISELSDLEEGLERARSTEDALELLRERIHPTHELYTALLELAEHWAHKLKDRASLEQSDSESLRDTIHDAQAAVKDVQAEIDEMMEALGDLRVHKGQLEIKVKTALGRIVDGYGVPLEKALEFPEVDDREQLEETAHQLRKRLSNLGPVNPVAVEEFNALEERRSYLQTQMDDLLAGKKALQKVIRAIDRKMRDRFMETFEAVDKLFQEVFSVLFPGGHAALTLTDEDDPTETGVEVVAQPRGKKLTRMSLMSGGEKSLVALALLFALYHTRPCPFYVLDEVEAALDDVNLRRFIELVGALRPRTQFIIITHQRRTMETADLLYGVSMQADGVSKVVSQKLERALELAGAQHSGEATQDEHAMV